MDRKTRRRQNHLSNRTNKVRTNKLVDKLTYSPKKHKQKVTRKLRQKLQAQALPTTSTAAPPTSLKFGSFNVNGLDIEASWAVEQLLTKRGFDVGLYHYSEIH